MKPGSQKLGRAVLEDRPSGGDKSSHPERTSSSPRWLREQIAELTTALESELTFREERVAEIRRALAEERYQVDAEAVASALLDSSPRSRD